MGRVCVQWGGGCSKHTCAYISGREVNFCHFGLYVLKEGPLSAQET